MRFLYCKLQAKALLALHVYGRQYLHAGTAAVCEPALSLSRAHTVYLTLWCELKPPKKGHNFMKDKKLLIHRDSLVQYFLLNFCPYQQYAGSEAIFIINLFGKWNLKREDVFLELLSFTIPPFL